MAFAFATKYRYYKWHGFENDQDKASEENNISVRIWESFILRVPALCLTLFNRSILGETEVWQMFNLLTLSPEDISYRTLCCLNLERSFKRFISRKQAILSQGGEGDLTNIVLTIVL